MTWRIHYFYKYSFYYHFLLAQIFEWTLFLPVEMKRIVEGKKRGRQPTVRKFKNLIAVGYEGRNQSSEHSERSASLLLWQSSSIFSTLASLSAWAHIFSASFYTSPRTFVILLFGVLQTEATIDPVSWNITEYILRVMLYNDLVMYTHLWGLTYEKGKHVAMTCSIPLIFQVEE